MKRAIVFGAGGFIGSHLVHRLKSEKYVVIGVDIKQPDFGESKADLFILQDLRNQVAVERIFLQHGLPTEIYQLAADMGGAGYVFTGEHDADIMSNSVLINLNILKALAKFQFTGTIFYSSSACVYPFFNQLYADTPECEESTAYPAQPDSEYGWEKLFSERMYSSFARNYGFNVRIARFHNIFGPEGTYTGGKEKAPAAICRKIAHAKGGESIEVWGDGEQTRSFLYIDECIEGIRRLMQAQFSFEPVNLGSEEIISINDLVHMIAEIASKDIIIEHIPGPQGVRGRCSDNSMIQRAIGWTPDYPLRKGLEHTYEWITNRINYGK
jgi:nucleoside-diphosphate-sugar epimerase